MIRHPPRFPLFPSPTLSRSFSLEVRSKTPLELPDTPPPLVILPVQGWNRIVKKALRFAFKISPNIRAIHVDCGQGSEIFRDEWCRFVEQPAMVAGLAAPE